MKTIVGLIPEKFLKNHYVDIKVGERWFWFRTEKVSEEDGIFKGSGGWGLDGEWTDMTACVESIDAYALGYNPQCTKPTNNQNRIVFESRIPLVGRLQAMLRRMLGFRV